MTKKEDGDAGNFIAGIILVALILALVALALSIGIALLGGVASAGAARGLFLGVFNFGNVFTEAHRKLP